MADKERMTVPGHKLTDTVKDLAARGDVREVCLLNEEKHLLDIPIRTGDPASPAEWIAVPVLAAIEAFSSLVHECTIEVEKVEKK